ncbi:MAG: 4-hydroxy-tetrahydrodipicolinate synthase [Deltaproteobacteria bacterium]|nr:MAG: 4-hydroxy-tetrahydrodipicolinate synthase [Deltaproteobacteria bacterium]
MNFEYRGVFTAIATPFGENGEVDLRAFERLARRQLERGIHGLVVCGTTGETPTLSQQEWASLVAAGVEHSDGKTPVIAGVGTNDTRSTVRNIERAAALGADAGLVVFPYYNKPNPEGIRQHVRACLKPGLPLMLYHVPGRTGQRLSGELLAEVCSFPGVIALKEASGDMRLGGDVITGTRTPILSGDDFSFLSLMSLGGSGVVSVVSNVAPAQTVEIYDHYRAGDPVSAAAALQRLWPLITFLFDEVNPVPCKAALEAIGLCSRATRLPLAPYDGPSPLPILNELGLGS